jgi:hypothetical protein
VLLLRCAVIVMRASSSTLLSTKLVVHPQLLPPTLSGNELPEMTGGKYSG